MPGATQPGTPRVVCVLGMHRSGTSLVAKLLNVVGVYLGPDGHLMPPGDDNPRGFWEHQRITDLDDEILARLGGSWHEPPTFGPGWESAPELGDLRQRARAVIEGDFGTAELWGWKDPRACLTLPFWRRLVPSMRYVICLRNPVDVARSLRRRDGFAPEAAAALWLTYVASSLEHTSGQPRLFVFYEDVMQDWRTELRRLARFVGAPETAGREDTQDAVRAFIDDALQHHRTAVLDTVDERTLPYPAKSVYLLLRAWAGRDGGGPGQPPAPGAVPGESVDLIGRYAVAAQADLDDLRVALAAREAELDRARRLQDSLVAEQQLIRRELDRERQRQEQFSVEARAAAGRADVAEQQRALLERYVHAAETRLGSVRLAVRVLLGPRLYAMMGRIYRGVRRLSARVTWLGAGESR